MTYEEVKSKYQQSNLAFYRDPADYALEPFRIFGPLYYVGDKRVCEHLIDTGDGLVLIDSGYPHTIHMLVDSIWRLGFDPKDIRYIIHTHGHYDHYGASNEFKKLYGCQLVISRTDAELLRSNPAASSDSWSSIVTPLAYIPPAFDRLLEDEEDFVCGNLTIHCVEVPGHTPGAMAFFFDLTEKGRTLRAGLFGGAGLGSVRKSVLEHRHQPLSLQQDMLDSLEKVRGQKVDIHLGNHPANNHTLERRARQLAGDPNAWIDPAAWVRFLDETRAKFEKMFAEEAAEET
ncbi:MAG: MBL fold metallo-hydrolase [Lachnospiraceae bacterium]|nr:MBL fold metallo-hydrolase [Lachnospiraceae bacterium]